MALRDEALLLWCSYVILVPSLDRGAGDSCGIPAGEEGKEKAKSAT